MDGTWERPGRSPAIGSAIIVLVLGSLYFVIGNLGSAVIIMGRLLSTLSSRGLSLTGSGGTAGIKGIADYFRGFYAENRAWILILTDACQWGILFGWGMAWTKKGFTRRVAAYARYDTFPAPMILAGILGALLIVPAFDVISRATDRLFPSLREWSAASAALYAWGSPAEAALVFGSICLTPAVCEEFLFRGVFQRGLERGLPFPWHFILSGTVFALYHQSPLGLFSLIPVGVFLGLLYWASSSIWPGMVFHALYNALILLLVNGKIPLPAWAVSGDYFSWPVWAVCALGTLALSAFILRAGLRRRGRGVEPAPVSAAP
jgi:membrane protease YdiL (CAAX protease family)